MRLKYMSIAAIGIPILSLTIFSGVQGVLPSAVDTTLDILMLISFAVSAVFFHIKQKQSHISDEEINAIIRQLAANGA